MTTSQYDALKGRFVQFRIRDVHLPDPAAILHDLFGERVLEGRVVDYSDNQSDGGVFLVIAVDGFFQPLVVGADRILPPPEGQMHRTTIE